MCAATSSTEKARISKILKDLGLQISRKTRTQLLGSSNVRSDMGKSSLAILESEASLTERVYGHKILGKWLTSPGDTPYQPSNSRIENLAIAAARHSYNRAGNCYGMSTVGVSFLCDYFLSQPLYSEAFARGDICIFVQKLPLFDHAMIRLDMKTKDESGNEVLVTAYIDPWLGSNECYTIDEFPFYREKVTKKLYEEWLWMNRPPEKDEKEVTEWIEKYDRETSRYKSENVAFIKPENMLTVASLDSPYSAQLFKRRFNEIFLNLNVKSKLSGRKDILLSAIATKDVVTVATFISIYLKQGLPLSSEILSAALAKKNEKINQIIAQHTLSSSNYYLGESFYLISELQKFPRNSLFITRTDDDYFLCQIDADGNVTQELIHSDAEGIYLGDIYFPLSEFSKFDSVFEQYSTNRGYNALNVSLAENRIQKASQEKRITTANNQADISQLKSSLKPPEPNRELEPHGLSATQLYIKQEGLTAKNIVVWLHGMVEKITENLEYYKKGIGAADRFTSIIEQWQGILNNLTLLEESVNEKIAKEIFSERESLELKLNLCGIRKKIAETECEAILMQADADKRLKEHVEHLRDEFISDLKDDPSNVYMKKAKERREKQIKEIVERLEITQNLLKKRTEEIQSWDEFYNEIQEEVEKMNKHFARIKGPFKP